jgi:hypothetical protein
MRATLFTVVTTAGILLSGMVIRQADAAMPLTTRLGTAATFHAETITNVCGTNGCVRVQTQRVVKHQKAGNVIPK